MRACDDICSILKARIAAEEGYSKSMSRAAMQSLTYEGQGKLQDVFDQMKVWDHF